MRVELEPKQLQKILDMIESYAESAYNYIPEDVEIIIRKIKSQMLEAEITDPCDYYSCDGCFNNVRTDKTTPLNGLHYCANCSEDKTCDNS